MTGRTETMMASEQLVQANGFTFVVEVTGDDSGPAPVDSRGGSALSFDGVRETVTHIGQELTQAWNAVRPTEASVEFGLKLTAKTGKLTGLLVEGGGEATLKVTMTWKATTPGPHPGP